MLALTLAAALSDIKISRTVDALTLGTAVLTIDGEACASTDAYGSNDCDLSWGSAYTGHATLNMTQDIVAGSQLVVDTKVDRVVPFKFTCDACGANCTVTIPVVSKTVTIELPPCPISAMQLDQGFNFTLPADSPVPVKTTIKGTAALNDASGNTLVHLTLDGELE